MAQEMTGRVAFINERRSGLLLTLALVLLGAWGLRMHDLEVRSLWADEGWTMLLSAGPRLDDITRTLAADQHPPLYFILLRLWRNVAGDTEFATRYLGVLCGVVAVAGMFTLARTLFDVRVGVLAALLLALSDLHIDLSQEVRHYSLLATWLVISSLFYVRWWKRPARATRIGYVLSTLALLYTHYLGFYVIMIQVLHLLLTARPWRKLREGATLMAAVGLGFLPWVPVVIDQNRLRWDNPLYYQNSLPNSPATFRLIRTALLGERYAIMAGLVLLGLVYVRANAARPDRPRFRLRPVWPILYPTLMIVVVTTTIIFLNERRQFLTVRNFILVVPALALLAAHGLSNLQRTARLFMTTLVVVIALTTVDARRHYPDWRAVVAQIAPRHLAGEPVLMDVWVGDFPVRYYLDRQLGADAPRISLREWRDRYRDQFLPRLLATLQPIDAFWLVYWGDEPLDEYGSLIAEAGFQRTATLVVMHQGTPLYSYRYDKLGDAVIARFGDLFALRQVTAPAVLEPACTATVFLWWTAEQPPPLDYSVSVFLLDGAGNLVAQHDGPPLDGRVPTSQWPPGAVQFDAHPVSLPANLEAGSYRWGVKVYWYGNGQPLPVTSDQPVEDGYVILGPARVETAR